MIYIFTAMHCEARPLIDAYGLKQIPGAASFRPAGSEGPDLLLTVTGVGEIAAAAAVAGVCTGHRPSASDFLLNLGACAGPPGTAGIFLIRKLTEQATGKTFFPDMLYRQDCPEAEVITCMRLRKRCVEQTKVSAPRLYDMEAAAVYQAGSYFFGPHQMVFLKIVSDHGAAGDGVTGERILRLMAAYQKEYTGVLARLQRISADSRRQPDRDPQEEALVRQLCADMHASRAMEDLIRQQVHFLSLSGTDCRAVTDSLYREHLLPCRDKKEGKRCFAEFKKRLF